MSLNWKKLRLALVPVVLLLCAGCGGISATGGVSPASFFLPGLLKADPPPAHPDSTLPAVQPDQEVAQS